MWFFMSKVCNILIMNAVNVLNLVKKYKDFEAVKGLSFDIKEREIFALVGPNGVGKSTTLKMLSTILSPTGGSAEIFGLDIVKDSKEIRKIISYLPEEAGAYKTLTGYEYLRFMASIFFRDKKQVLKTVEYGAEICGLKDKLKDKVKTYSKGMTRKLLLSRAVMIKPRFAILDEPTSGLDILNSFEIRKIIKQLAKDGMTVLLSSHNMFEIEFLSDRLGIMNNGKLLACGAPRDLKEKFSTNDLEEVFIKLIQ